jgi:Domain of unknown function (DUF4440)
MFKAILASCFLLLSFISCKDSEKDIRNYIADSESRWAESVATNDTTVLHKILADDFVWVLDGRILDKKTAIKEAGDGPGDFLSDHLDTIRIRIYENTAVANGTETWERRNPENKIYKGKFVWTDTWLKRNDLWQIISAEDISIPEHP